MKSSIFFSSLVFVSFLFGGESAIAQTLSLEAVKINDVSITPSNSILVKPGDTIVVEIFASDWSPNGQRLHAFQADIARTSFISGATGDIRPVGWDRPLITVINCFPATPSCPPEFSVCNAGGFGGFCVGENYDPAQGVFINPNRADWVFFDSSSGSPFPGFSTVDFAGVNFRYGAIVFPSIHAQVYAPPSKYCGTLKLEVSDNASGTFSFEVLGPSTTLTDTKLDPIEPLTLLGLTIEIDPCGNGAIDAGEACDGEDLGVCPGACADDCKCLPEGIPSVSAWGLVVLALVLLVAGRVYFGRRSRRTNEF